jgi:HK97 family phage major capsid protein
MRIISSTMLYGLKLKEETEILHGDNLGNHLNGLVTQAGAYAGTYDAPSNDQQLDKLRHAILEIEDGDGRCDFIVLSPVDWHNIQLLKDEAGGTNLGEYLVSDPLGGVLVVPQLWGRTLVVSNSMTAGTFLVGSTESCAIYDRQQANVMVSTEHSDYFVKNLVAIRAEERICVAVYRTADFVTGTF